MQVDDSTVALSPHESWQRPSHHKSEANGTKLISPISRALSHPLTGRLDVSVRPEPCCWVRHLDIFLGRILTNPPRLLQNINAIGRSCKYIRRLSKFLNPASLQTACGLHHLVFLLISSDNCPINIWSVLLNLHQWQSLRRLC
jgi:hypothetical protein